MECPKVPLSLLAIRNSQVVERALRKVTGDFTVLVEGLQSCTCYHGKLKEAESFNIVEGRPCLRYSIVIACAYTQMLIHRTEFYILHTKGLA